MKSGRPRALVGRIADWSHQHERWEEWVLGGAALLVIPVMVVEESSLDDPWPTLAGVVNWMIWSVFAAGLGLSIARMFRGDAKALRVAFFLDVAIVVFSFPLLWPKTLQSFRALRLLRLLPLLRFGAATRKLALHSGTYEAGMIAGLVVLGGGTAFHELEPKVASTWQGVYWAVVTMTTVGYGDYAPQTDLGKALSVVIMLVGIGLLAFVIGAIAERFVRRDVQKMETDVAGDIASAEADLLGEIRLIAKSLRGVEQRIAELARSRPT